MSIPVDSHLHPIIVSLTDLLDPNWLVFGIFWALAIGAVILKRLGSFWSLLRVLHPPLILVMCAWSWGRDGFDVLGNTILLTGGTKAVVLALSAGLITLRRLAHLQAPGALGMVTSILSGPVGLGAALDLLVSAVGPRSAESKKASGMPASGEPTSPFAPATGSEDNAGLREAASGVEETFQKVWNSGYEAEPVDAKTFKHLDLAFYDRFRDSLAAYGFSHVGDVELVSARVPGVKRTFIRVMLSGDHGVMAACSHVKMGITMKVLTMGAKNFVTRSTDFESEFTDGSFVVTTNQIAVGNFDHGDAVNSQFFEGLTLEELGHRHYQRLQAHGMARGAGLVSIRTLDEVNASQARLQHVKSAGRGADGMTRDEFRRAAGSTGKDADDLYDAWQGQRQQPAM